MLTSVNRLVIFTLTIIVFLSLHHLAHRTPGVSCKAQKALTTPAARVPTHSDPGAQHPRLRLQGFLQPQVIQPWPPSQST